jgi:ribonuclease E
MKKMLINALHPEEIRVAVVDDGVLTGFHLESALKEQLRGNIYKGRISKVEHSLNAVFVDFGREKHGLLPVNDINPDLVGGVHDRKNIIASLHKGMELLVQVVREEKGAKGALLTTDISLPGRYLVLLPHQDMAGISRKIDDEKQRRRLREIIDQIKPPEGSGVIVRTAGMDRNKTELGRDMAYLTRLWKSIEEQFRSAECPSIVYKEGDIIIRTVRDYLSPDTAEILVDDEDTEKRVLSFMKTVMPKLKGIVKSYRQNRPLFTKFELEQQIEAVYGAKVRLRSGGSIVIEPTEAMVVIDVNSGQATNNRSIEETAYETNREAAAEIARQLVLRDLGGLIVIDFIDMRAKEHIRGVEKALRDALKNDRAHLVLGKISKFGIMELSRERLSPPLTEKSHITCPVCSGLGLVRSVESAAVMALREIQLALARNKTARIRASMPREVALHVLNRQRRHLMRLEQEFGAEIIVAWARGLPPGQIVIETVE